MSISATKQLSKDVKVQAEISDTLKMKQKPMDVSLHAVKKNMADFKQVCNPALGKSSGQAVDIAHPPG